MAGRPPKLTYRKLRQIDAWWSHREWSAKVMARILKVDPSTVYDAANRRGAYQKVCAMSMTEARRTPSQNSLLWAIYTEILDKGGEAVRGFDKDDLHEFFLIEHFGGEVKGLFGRKRLRPLQRSSALSKMQFAEHIEFILHFMAEHGVVIETMEAA